MSHKQLVEVCNFPETTKVAQVPSCAGTLDNKPVDSIVGAYLLNQAHRHTETVYDSVLAALGGTITYTYTAPRNIALNLLGVTITNDTLVQFWTDFGDGYNDVGAGPDHTYNADGEYEIKSYAILNSRSKILLAAKEVTILGGVVTYSGVAGSQAVSRNYSYSVGAAYQDYCDGVLVGGLYNPNLTPYTLQGTPIAFNRPLFDDLEDNADYQAAVASTTTVPTAVTPVYSTNRTLQTINTTPVAYNVAAIANAREITVQNITNSDVTITTSQGIQTVATRGVITLSNPSNTTVNHNVFTGNITVTFLSSVGGNIGGVAPRVIINQKGY